MIGSLWILGAKTPWTPNFDAKPLSPQVVGATEGPVFIGARLFYKEACINCHLVESDGGRRGPDLTYVGDKLTRDDLVTRIVNGGVNMPAYGSSLNPEELNDLVAFLQNRKRPVSEHTGAALTER
jgi:ubiquinol-cytochrome c reductase cytochrome b subunit